MWRRRSLILPWAFIGLLLLFVFFLSAPFFRHNPVVETDCLPPPPTPPSPTPTPEPTPIPTLANRDRLGSFLTNLGLVGNGVEVDVKRGVFSEKVLKEWKGEHYYLVDIWQEQENYVDIANVNQAVQESFMAEALSKVSPWKDRVTVVRNYSVLASKLFPEEFFDFIYLDARHNYEEIKEDLHAWYPKLKQGGLFAGHDFLMPTSKRVSLWSREQCSNLLTSSDFEIDCMKRKIAGRVGISSNLIGRHHTQTALVRRQDGSHGPFYPNLEFLLINQPSFFILFLFVVSYFNTLPLPSHSPLARLFPSLEIFLFSSNHPFITPEI